MQQSFKKYLSCIKTLKSITKMLKTLFFVLHIFLVCSASREDKDHPKIHFPKKADTAHEGIVKKLCGKRRSKNSFNQIFLNVIGLD